MHKCMLLVFGMFAWLLPIISSAQVAEKPGKYRADAVIVLPGLGGSFGAELFCNNAKTIRNFEFTVRKLLRVVKITVPKELTPDPILNKYQALEEELKRSFAEVVVVPYDWRRDASYNVETYVLPVYRRLAEKYQRVHFVAHSMGGILVRTLLEREGDSHLGRVAFCATPHEGAVDAYRLWNGGVTAGGSILIDTVTSLIFSHIQSGCGCGDKTFLQFLHDGCSTYPHPMTSIAELMPTFLFLRKEGADGKIVRPNNYCEQNPTLPRLNSAVESWNIPIRAHYFIGRSQSTPRLVLIEDKDKKCSRLRWPDGDYSSTIHRVNGDNRVFANSGCRALWSGPNPSSCTFTDQIRREGKLYAESKNMHGDCTKIFKEEIANFLLYGRVITPPTTTTSTTTTSTTSTTFVVTTTTEFDPTTTVSVTTTTIPDGSLAGVRISPSEDLGLIYTQRFVVAYADADGGGVLDDDVSLHPNTVWSADDSNMINFYPVAGEGMSYVGFVLGTTTIRVSFDPDGDGPLAPYEDAISVTITDGSIGEQ